MGIKSIVLTTTVLVVSTSVNAATITQGYLTTNDDGSTNIITDSLNNVEYLRLDVLADLNYAGTLAILSTQDGGGWSIANADDAINFVSASIGADTPSCSHDGTSVLTQLCGQLSGWYDGKLGNDYSSYSDYAWFMDANGEADYIHLPNTGGIQIQDYDLNSTDIYATYSTDEATTVSWLTVRPTVVPIPPAVVLFGSGLLGLIGAARRKVHA